MSKPVDDQADTALQLESRRERRGSLKQDVFPAEPTTGELARAMAFQQEDIDRHERALGGDGSARDLGLRGDMHQVRGDVQQLRTDLTDLRKEVASHRSQYGRDMETMHETLAVVAAKRTVPRWLAAAACVAVFVAGFSIAYRAIAQEVRAWGARGEQLERAEAPL